MNRVSWLNCLCKVRMDVLIGCMIERRSIYWTSTAIMVSIRQPYYACKPACYICLDVVLILIPCQTRLIVKVIHHWRGKSYLRKQLVCFPSGYMMTSHPSWDIRRYSASFWEVLLATWWHHTHLVIFGLILGSPSGYMMTSHPSCDIQLHFGKSFWLHDDITPILWYSASFWEVLLATWWHHTHLEIFCLILGSPSGYMMTSHPSWDIRPHFGKSFWLHDDITPILWYSASFWEVLLATWWYHTNLVIFSLILGSPSSYMMTSHLSCDIRPNFGKSFWLNGDITPILWYSA